MQRLNLLGGPFPPPLLLDEPGWSIKYCDSDTSPSTRKGPNNIVQCYWQECSEMHNNLKKRKECQTSNIVFVSSKDKKQYELLKNPKKLS